MLDTVVDVFFDAYCDVPLTGQLDDQGIDRDIIPAEILRHAPHVLMVLKRRKLLDGIVRRQLEGFDRSGAIERASSCNSPEIVAPRHDPFVGRRPPSADPFVKP